MWLTCNCQFWCRVGRIELDPVSRSPISPHIDPSMSCRVGWFLAGVCAVTGKRSFWGWRKGRVEEVAPWTRGDASDRHVATPDAETSSIMSGAGNGPPISTFSFIQGLFSCWSLGLTSLLIKSIRLIIAA